MIAASVGHHCPSCVKKSGQQVIPARQLLNPGTGDFIVTKILVAINVVVHFISSVGQNNPEAFGGELARIEPEGILRGIQVADGDWWRLLTSGFLHADIMHLAFNMIGLWIFGSQLEPRLGREKYTLLYFGSMLAGSAAVMLLANPLQATLGASGAIYGLLGAFAMNAYAQGRNLWQEGIIGMIGIYVFMTFAVSNISIGGHMGGLAGGLILGFLFFSGAKKLNNSAVLGLGAALTVAAFALGVVLSG